MKKHLVIAAILVCSSYLAAMDKWAALMPKIDRLPNHMKEWVDNACGDRTGWSAADHKENYPRCSAVVTITTRINEAILKKQQTAHSSGNP